MIDNVGVSLCGVRYNSYLITGEKTALIDSTPEECAAELIQNIRAKLGKKPLDYIIFNHTEADRAGAFGELLREFPDAVVYASVSGLKNLYEQVNREFNQEPAKSGATLRLGENISLRFLITHNINWADSIMVYYEEEKALFSCDAFSDEGCGHKAYYDEKLSYLSAYVQSAMQQLSALDIDTICPGSGEECKNPADLTEKYTLWSKKEKKDKKSFAVIYQSNSKNTEKAAKRAYELLSERDCNVVLVDAGVEDTKTVLETVYNSDAVLFGTPTIYRNIPEKLLAVVVGLNHYEMSDKSFACFGSFGWSGEAPNLVYSYLRARHFETYKAPFRFMFSPTAAEEEDFEAYVLGFYENTLKNS